MEMNFKPFELQVAEQVSPLKQEALSVLEMAMSVQISSDITFEDAIDVKNEINATTKKVKELRLELTRPVDKFKATIMDAERDILSTLSDAKDMVTTQIQVWETQKENERLAELQRVNQITQRFASFYLPTVTSTDELRESGAKLKQAFEALEPEDKNNLTIKTALLTTANRLTARIEELDEAGRQRIENEKLKAAADAQTKQRLAQEAEQRRLDAEEARQKREADEREQAKELEKSKAAERKIAAAAPKSNTTLVTEVEVADATLVPRNLCSPDMVLIRAAVKAGDLTVETAAAIGISITQRKVTR